MRPNERVKYMTRRVTTRRKSDRLYELYLERCKDVHYMQGAGDEELKLLRDLELPEISEQADNILTDRSKYND